MIKRIVVGMLLPFLLGLQGCTSMFFYPMPQHVMTPDRLGIAYEDIELASADGTRLHGWWLHARQPAGDSAADQPGLPRAIVLFFHGNAQNISTHFAHVHWLVDYGFDVVMVDYRGYGKSAGKAGLAGSLQDIRATLRYVHESRQDDLPMLVIGQSIGGSMAVAALAPSELKDQLSGIVLIGSFSDYRKITQQALSGFWLTWPLQWPLSFTVDNSYSPQAFIAELAPVPVLIMHGRQDPVVPVSHAQALYERALAPRYLEIIEGDHNHILASRENRERLLEYLNRFIQQP
jgi:hypothetical protein